MTNTAQLSDERKAIESPFMGDYWKLRKQYGEPEDRNEYWAELVENREGRKQGVIYEIAEKYNNDSYVECILLAFVDDLEARQGKWEPGRLTLSFVNELRRRRGLPKVGVIKNE